MSDDMLNQMPGKPHEPDVERVVATTLDMLLKSHGKVLSPIGATPATTADLVDALIAEGGETIWWCVPHAHGAHMFNGVVSCSSLIYSECRGVEAVVFPIPAEKETP